MQLPWDVGVCVGASACSGLFLIWQLLRMYFPFVFEDLYLFRILIKSYKFMKSLTDRDTLLYDCLLEKSNQHPNSNFVVYESQKWTYREMLQWVNQHARVFHKIGLEPFQKIALMMMNEPAFVAVWVGASANGLTTGLINYQLRAKSLLHCITIAEAKVLVIGSDPSIVEAVKEIKNELSAHGIKIFTYEKVENCEFDSFSELVEKQSREDIPRSWRRNFCVKDPTCYIYTSGTTGLPKAVNFGTHRAWKASAVSVPLQVTRDDIIYTPLPLYHAAAASLGLAVALSSGCTIVLRKKFSASQLWNDCRRYNVTIVQYIGETMRYVVGQPPTPNDRDHCVRAVIGNGLRPDVWRTLIERHGEGIHVFELYAATEGNLGFMNVFNKFGCVGTLSPLYQILTGAYIVKFDNETEEIVRDKNGKAILADWDEPGLVIGKIKKNFEISSYKGAPKQTSKKILRDVFQQGDEYFNSGDLMMRDRQYRMYFCDRVGDTFRWKGENVSTNEVGDIIGTFSQISLANVYGVEVPGNEGRAGMVALILDESARILNVKSLYQHIVSNLPSYARPLFLRVDMDMEVTGTFKLKKVALKSQGFNPQLCPNANLYVIDHKSKSYLPITSEIFNDIQAGRIRL